MKTIEKVDDTTVRVIKEIPKVEISTFILDDLMQMRDNLIVEKDRLISLQDEKITDIQDIIDWARNNGVVIMAEAENIK